MFLDTPGSFTIPFRDRTNCLLPVGHLAVGVASCIVGLWIILLLSIYVGNGTPMWGSSPGLTDCYSPLGPVSGHRCFWARLAWLIQP